MRMRGTRLSWRRNGRISQALTAASSKRPQIATAIRGGARLPPDVRRKETAERMAYLSDHGRGAVKEIRVAATSNARGLFIAPVCTTQGQRHNRSSFAGCTRLNTVGARPLVGQIRVGGRFTSRNERSWRERRTQLQEQVLDRSANPQPFSHVSAGYPKMQFRSRPLSAARCGHRTEPIACA
jgi:hypothetical protein